jgi:hypothetical protein
MGSENVETLKRADEALNRGDFEGLAAAYASDAELVDRANAPDQSTAVTGRDAMICATHWHGRGRASGPRRTSASTTSMSSATAR